jgi:hypothetical protein
LKPGNAGRAKGPDFWCAFEDGEVTVIGDEPANTNYDPGPSKTVMGAPLTSPEHFRASSNVIKRASGPGAIAKKAAHNPA